LRLSSSRSGISAGVLPSVVGHLTAHLLLLLRWTTGANSAIWPALLAWEILVIFETHAVNNVM